MTNYLAERRFARHHVSTTRPIVLIGAARSGTKIVRDVLAQATHGGRVPYDIGFVWRYGNESVPHDVLDPQKVTPRTSRFIRSYLDRYARNDSTGRPLVVEKTVGNALRVPFVARVLPDAVFVHLIRDGVDVVESTRRQWLLPPDRRYLIGKVRHFPVRLAPSYGRKYLASQMRHYLSRDSRVGTWGPRYPGIDEDVQAHDLLGVCAKQWQECVELARTALKDLSAPSVELRYEELVTDPFPCITRVLTQLGMPADKAAIRGAATSIESGHHGSGRRSLSAIELRSLHTQIGETLHSLGYPPAIS
jgi:hypothetical protein